ncbi:hypothetical protein K461DRAFT_5263 [Myriangium duriaei CBS 260.36]|uniref:Small ribosomal subunit protein mS41 n=1 Tax=Myriangium duriaei CBS 260.36 TaxID=1168546 RepID=A0A9P4J854_9PEZI|nr:hypothetical protein K461DRAFT_5263 [Myriangium duriaei CBS 260.36]
MIPRKAPRLLTTTFNAFTQHSQPLAILPSQIRCIHKRAPLPVPSPTPFVPDAPTFLTLIGRNMSAHASKIPSWEALFNLSSEQLRESGLEPARARRYLLRWRAKFRAGEFGIGGDLARVQDGIGELRVVEIADPTRTASSLTHSAGKRRVVVNVSPGAGEEELQQVVEEVEQGQTRAVQGVKIKQMNMIAGKNVRLLKGLGRAQIQVMEGLWEHKRGKKVDGGERRKEMVRAKRRAEENKKR